MRWADPEPEPGNAHSMSELAIQTLHVAAREIGVALNDARAALEAHVEQPGQPALLERCATELHQAQGALRVLEI